MKKYYVIDKTLERVYPQVENVTKKSVSIANIFEPYVNIVDPKKLELKFKLEKRAKLTDVLTTIPSGTFNYLISERAKNVLQTMRISRHVFFDATVMEKDIPHRYSWLHLMKDTELLASIDYDKSEFRYSEYGLGEGVPIKIDSYAHYKSLEASSDEPTAFDVEMTKIVMKDDFDRSLDMFFLNPFDFNIYVSEELKKRMEEAKITGVCFRDPVVF
ncbi:MAG: hypothetical protein J6J93_02150 [Muribaculaceae bacterium]|nr:hypothetical protein [Muribaculaceae bacterium]